MSTSYSAVQHRYNISWSMTIWSWSIYIEWISRQRNLRRQRNIQWGRERIRRISETVRTFKTADHRWLFMNSHLSIYLTFFSNAYWFLLTAVTRSIFKVFIFDTSLHDCSNEEIADRCVMRLFSFSSFHQQGF